MPAQAPPVLVVEDDPDLLLMLVTALELAGRRVLTARNGRDALQLARARRPSLVVLDLMLPVVSGEEVAQALLADETLRNIPVIVVSARHDAELVAARIRAKGCLTKPLSLDAFVRLVNETSLRIPM